ncbi:TadE/TadG family type IV pilus assembly protein [Mumia sp.]|uniref:TadE/TadG family type IV pilus assembly protein n=1 Tax=Mumia sp. TaxID=1965300 RepID=UPI002633E610|nr:TadE/TadG family type IV pilus assembly protein [Mumia sp.]MDD9349383.1 pilus assembly protein TadG-related protein [Mumia sp.]
MTGVKTWVRRVAARRDEAGSVAPFVVIVSVGLLLLAGMVIDGGRQLNAKGIAIAYAQEAARAGAQAVNVADPSLNLISSAALSAARNYCEQAQAGDPTLVRCSAAIRDVTVNGSRTSAVEVETEVSRSAIIIGMIGRETLTASGVAQARPVSGIDAPDDAKVSTLEPPSVAPPGGPGDDDEDEGRLPISSWSPPSPSPIEECRTPDPDEDEDENPEASESPPTSTPEDPPDGTDPTETPTPTRTTPTSTIPTCPPAEG